MRAGGGQNNFARALAALLLCAAAPACGGPIASSAEQVVRLQVSFDGGQASADYECPTTAPASPSPAQSDRVDPGFRAIVFDTLGHTLLSTPAIPFRFCLIADGAATADYFNLWIIQRMGSGQYRFDAQRPTISIAPAGREAAGDRSFEPVDKFDITFRSAAVFEVAFRPIVPEPETQSDAAFATLLEERAGPGGTFRPVDAARFCGTFDGPLRTAAQRLAEGDARREAIEEWLEPCRAASASADSADWPGGVAAVEAIIGNHRAASFGEKGEWIYDLRFSSGDGFLERCHFGSRGCSAEEALEAPARADAVTLVAEAERLETYFPAAGGPRSKVIFFSDPTGSDSLVFVLRDTQAYDVRSE